MTARHGLFAQGRSGERFHRGGAPMTTTTAVHRRTWSPIAIPLGLVVLVAGAWGALAPLVGPYFSFGFDTSRTWTFSEQHWTLSVIPGAVAATAGLLLLLPTRGRVVAWIAAAAGAWFA